MTDERNAPTPLNNRAPDPIRANLANKHRAEEFRKRMRGDCGCGKGKSAATSDISVVLARPLETQTTEPVP